MDAEETHLRILAVVPPSRRDEISRQLAALNANVLFVARSAEASAVIHEGDVFQVALLPATLSDTDWWELMGRIGAFLNPSPGVAGHMQREATFQLWSGVLGNGWLRRDRRTLFG